VVNQRLQTNRSSSSSVSTDLNRGWQIVGDGSEWLSFVKDGEVDVGDTQRDGERIGYRESRWNDQFEYFRGELQKSKCNQSVIQSRKSRIRSDVSECLQ